MDEFNDAMRALGPFPDDAVFVCAVSGGGDSMALCHFLNLWIGKNQKLYAVTVDHGLRPESTAEARQVNQWLCEKNIAHHILTWDGQKPDRNIQHHARAARYDLLTKFCTDRSNAFLCTAHHQDDQIETFLSRLCRGSGVYGLSGMSARQIHNGTVILRPFLQFEKSRLSAALTNARQNWIEDPSNNNDRFTRVKLRQLRGTFADLGLDARRLLRTIDRMQSARSVIERQVDSCAAESVHWSQFGFCQIDGALWAKYDQEIAMRVLGECLASIGGGDYTPRYDSLYELYIGLCGGEILTRTLGGCIIESDGAVITIMREHAAIAAATDITAQLVWDGRFEIRADGTPDATDCFIAPLGIDGWRDIVQSRPDLRDIRMPVHAKYALPAIKMHCAGVDETLAAPHLNYWKDQKIQNNWSALSINFRPRHHKDAFGLPI